MDNVWFEILLARGIAMGWRMREAEEMPSRVIDALCDILADAMDASGFPRPKCDYPITRAEVARARYRVETTGDRMAWFRMEDYERETEAP